MKLQCTKLITKTNKKHSYVNEIASICCVTQGILGLPSYVYSPSIIR